MVTAVSSAVMGDPFLGSLGGGAVAPNLDGPQSPVGALVDAQATARTCAVRISRAVAPGPLGFGRHPREDAGFW